VQSPRLIPFRSQKISEITQGSLRDFVHEADFLERRGVLKLFQIALVLCGGCTLLGFLSVGDKMLDGSFDNDTLGVL
jgi:hypothetical protein